MSLDSFVEPVIYMCRRQILLLADSELVERK